MQDTLYHAMSYENALLAFRRNTLRGHSTHRFHENGTVPWYPTSWTRLTAEAKERQIARYLESKWHYGVCLTRDAAFAHSWNDVVLVFDRNKLKQNHPLKPYNWFETRVKGEAEEFLITGAPGWRQAYFDSRTPDKEKAKQLGMTVKELCNIARFFRSDDSYLGEVENLHRYVTEVRIVCTPTTRNPRLLGKQDWSLQRDFGLEQFNKHFEDVFNWCQRYSIPLKMI